MEAVILIGIQATGKSTFCQERFASTYVRVNLDALKTRRREDCLLESCLQSKRSFVVDNTNVLASERARYIRLARASGYTITGYFFESCLSDALRRNQQRCGKALIPEKGILAKYRALQPPRYQEGFDRLFYVIIDSQNHFVIHPYRENEWINKDRRSISTNW